MMILRKSLNTRGEICLAILFLLCIVHLSSPQTLSAQEERVAVVSTFDGVVKIQHGGVWKTVTKIGNRMKNSAIYSDDTVMTMPGTKAVLIFNDNTRLEVKEGTTMTISEKLMVGEVAQHGYVTDVAGTPKKEIVRNIKIKAGGLWANVTPSKSVLTEFETPTGVASVRGTQLSVDYDATTGIAAVDLGQGKIVFVSPGENAVFDMGGGDIVHVAVPESGSGVALNVVSGNIEVNTPAGDVVNMNTGDGVEVASSDTGDTSVAVTATGEDGAVSVETNAGNVEMNTGDAVEVSSSDSGETSVTVTATGQDGGVSLETSEGTLTIGDQGSLEVTVDSGTNEITVTDAVGEVTITTEEGATTDVGAGDGVGTVTTGGSNGDGVSGAIDGGANPGAQGTPAGGGGNDDGNGGGDDGNGGDGDPNDPNPNPDPGPDPVPDPIDPIGPTLNPNAPSGGGNNPNDLIPQKEDEESNDTNQSPVAADDSFNMFEGGTLTIQTDDVLGNDSDPDNDSLSISAFDSTTTESGLVVAGSLIYTPPTMSNNNGGFTLDYYGSDSFTYTIADGNGGTAVGTVDVNVLPVNDAPDFTKGSDQTVNEDSGDAEVTGWATGISEGAVNEDDQTLTFNVTNDNDSFFAVQPSINAEGKLTYKPADDAFGTANVTVNLSDDGGTPNGGEDTSGDQTFALTINPINDVPDFTKGSDLTVFEDAGSQNVNDWPSNISTGPANESGQSWDFEITNYDQDLFEGWGMPAIDGSGQLSFTPMEDANGSTELTVSLIDDGMSVINGVLTSDPKTFTETFTITIDPVNDVPVFTIGDDQVALEDSGLSSVGGWATEISKGPSDESDQVLTFNVTSDNDTLFSALPTIDPDTGDLSYTLADNITGTAVLSVSLVDNGGTANGGVNTTPIQAFTITVNNDFSEGLTALSLMDYYGVGGFAIPEKTTSVVIGNDLFESVDISPSGYIHGSANGGPGEDGLVMSIVDNDNGDQGIMADDGFGISFDKEDSDTGAPVSSGLVATYRDHDENSTNDEGPNIAQGGTKGTSFYSRATGNSVTANTSFDDLLVSHEYRLDDFITDSHNVLVADVTITNTGSETIRNLKYRKKADFDIDETDWAVDPENEPIDTFILSPIPTDPNSLIETVAAPLWSTVGNSPLNNDTTNNAPGEGENDVTSTADNAAVFQMDLGTLEPGQSITFPLFYAADNPTVHNPPFDINRTVTENLQESIGRVGSTTYIEISDPSNTNAVFALGSGNQSGLYVPVDVENVDASSFNIINDTLSTMIGLLAKTTYSSHAEVIADDEDGVISATDIAVGAYGNNIYVTDNGSGRLLSVSPDGTVNTVASGLSDPTGVAVHSGEGETVYVTDNGSKEVLTLYDGVLGDVIPVGFMAGLAGDGEFNLTGIAIDDYGDVSRPIYVTDAGTDRVFRLFYGDGWAGEDVVTEGNTGGRVDEPQAIAFGNGEDVMYVVENGFDAILRIDQLTGETNRIATERSSDWDINEPIDLTVGSDGFLYFVDAGNESVFKVDPVTGETKFLASSDTTGGLLSNPTGIAINSDGDIYISSATNGIVRLLKTTNDKTIHAQAIKLRADMVAHAQEFSSPEIDVIISDLDIVIAKLQNNVDVGPIGDDGTSNDGISNPELYVPATALLVNLEDIRNDFIAHAGLGTVFSHTNVTHLLLDALKLADDSVALNLEEIDAELHKAWNYLSVYVNTDDADLSDDNLLTELFDIQENIEGVSSGGDPADYSAIRRDIKGLLTNLVDHIAPNSNPFHFLKPFTNTDAVNMMFDNGVGGAFDPALAVNTRNVIDNGTLTAGINTDGSLIEPSDNTGLRMKGFSNSGEAGGDVLADDGYGVSYSVGGVSGGDFGVAAIVIPQNFVAKVGSGAGADSSTHGTTIYTKHNKSRMETFVSQAGVRDTGDGLDYSSKGDLAVTHQFKLLPQSDNAPEGDSRENVMSVEVTLTNTGDNTITDLRYRRLADIDSGSPDTWDDSLFTVHDDGNSSDSYGIAAPSVDGTSSDPDPPSLDPTTGFGNSFPGTYAGDLEALIQLDLDSLAPGESKTFEFFYAGDNSTNDLSNRIDEVVTNARYVSSTSNSEVPLPTFALGTGTSIESYDRADVASREASYFNIFTDTMTLMIQNMAKAEYVALTVADQAGTSGLISEPTGITIDSNEDLIVTNWHSVLRIVKDNTYPSGYQPTTATTIADNGTSGGLIKGPRRSTIDSYGNFIIADPSAKKVLKVIPTTGETTVIADVAGGGGFIANPSGLTVEPISGDLIVTDWGSDSILRIKKDVSSPTGYEGSASVITDSTLSPGFVIDPADVAIDSNGDLIVAAFWTSQVLKVNPSDGSVGVIADSLGTGGLVSRPYGIKIDSDGLLVVVDVGDDEIIKIDPVTGDTKVIANNSSTDGKIVYPDGLEIDSDGSIYLASYDSVNSSIVKLVETTSTESLLALAEKIRADIDAHNAEYSVSIIDDLADESFITGMNGVIADIESNLSNPDSPGIWVSREDIFNSLNSARDILAEHADMQEPVQHASIAHLLLDSKRLAGDNVRLNLTAIDTEIGMAQDFLLGHMDYSGNTTVHRYLLSQFGSIASNIDTLQADIYDINVAALIESGVEEAFLDVIDHMLFTDQERSHSHDEHVHNPFEPHSPNGERDGDVMSSSEGLELMDHYGVGGFSIPENPNSVVIGNDFFTHIDIGPEGSIHGVADGKNGLVPSILNSGLNEEDRGILFDDGFGISFDKPGVDGALRATFGGGSDAYPYFVGTEPGQIDEDIEVNGSKGKAFYSRSDGNSVTANTSFDDVQISHAYRLVESENSGANVLVAEVTITNMGLRTISDLRYRRKTDFDISEDKNYDYYSYTFYSYDSYYDKFDVPEPDPNDELVDAVAAPYWDDDGLDPTDTISNVNSGTSVDDNAAIIEMGLGTLGPGESITFPIIIAGDNPTVDEDNPTNDRTASENLAASIADVVSTTYIEVSSTLLAESRGTYALGTGSLNLETPTEASEEGKEHFQLITDAMSLMIGHLADTSYSSHSRTLADFTGYGGVAIDSNGDVIVTNVSSHEVNRVDPLNGNVSLIDSGGFINGPIGVTVADNGDIFGVSVFSASVFKIVETSPGVWSTSNVASNSSTGGQIVSPRGIAIDSNGDLIVTDTFRNSGSILRVAPDGSSIDVIADKASSGGMIDFPFGIAIGSDGTLIVSDTYKMVTVDPISGETNKLATFDSTNGDISAPRQLAMDDRGFLYTADINNSSIFKVHPLTGKTRFIASNSTTDGLIDVPLGIAIDNSDDTLFVSNIIGGDLIKLPKTTNDKQLLAFAEKLRADILTHDDRFPDTEHIGVLSDLNTIILKIKANVTSADTFSNTEIFGDLESARNDFIDHAGLGYVFSHLDISHLLLDAFKMAHDSVPLYIDEINAVVSKAKHYLENYNFDYEGGNEHDGFLTDINSIISDIGVVNSNIRDLDTARAVKGELRGLLTDLVNHVSPGNNPFKFLQPFTNNDAVQMMADNGVGGAFIPSLAINTENVIDNGTLTVGVSRDGSLIEPNLTNNNGGVGLVLDGFTNNGNEGGDVLAVGAPSEGYGVSYNAGVNSFLAEVGNVFSSDPASYGTTIYTKGNQYRRETYTSEVGVDTTVPSLKGDLSITHQFKLIPPPYEAPEGYSREKVLSVEVTVNNAGDNTITGLNYRRVADIDIGNPFPWDDSEFTVPDITTPIVSGAATLQIVGAPLDTNFDFDPTTSVSNSSPATYTDVTVGHTALIQFNLDTLAPGQTKTFEFFYAGDDSSTDLTDTISEAVNDARYVSSTRDGSQPYPTFALGTGSSTNSFDSAYVASNEASHFNMLTDTVSLMLRNLALVKYVAKTVVSEDSLGTDIMDNPKDITIDNNGDLIVVDESSEKVLRIQETTPGVWTTTVITDQLTSGNLIVDPNGVAVASNGDIFITDDGTGTDAILKVDPSDGSTSVIASRSTEGSSIVRNPSGIAIDVNGDLIVTDESSEKVLRLTDHGDGWGITVITDLATSGNLLEDPNGVAIASNGDIIVTEDTVDGIMRIDPSNGSTTVIASQGTKGHLVFDNPEGLAIDNNGLLIVVNNNDGTPNGIDSVLKVDPVTGDTRIIATEASTGGKIDEPKGVEVASDGSIFVADTGSDSIVELEETTSTDFLLAFARKIRGDMEEHDDEHVDTEDATVQTDHDDFLRVIDDVIIDIETNIADPNSVNKTVISGKLKGAWDGLVDHANMQEPAQHAAVAHILLDSHRLAQDQVRLNLAPIHTALNQVKIFMAEHINDFGDTTVHRGIEYQIDSILANIGVLRDNIYSTVAANSIQSEIKETFCDVIDHTVRSDQMEGANPFHFCHGNMDEVLIP